MSLKKASSINVRHSELWKLERRLLAEVLHRAELNDRLDRDQLYSRVKAAINALADVLDEIKPPPS
ncbi:MAG: hypothetical protein M5R40_17880 [Anaerolineae bacterium]|nr:hypothetical protein [Anaerolineae bacterium]